MRRHIYTSKDVAKLAGVSQPTVSRVFSKGARVSREKKKRVLEAAKELNYQPNGHARSLANKKTKIIGIVMRDIRNPFYSAVLEIFYNRLFNRGYHVIFVKSENEIIQEEEILQLLEFNVEGVIISDALLSSRAAERFRINAIVVVLFNSYSKEAEYSSIFCDNYIAAKEIGQYLIDSGHSSFAFISGPADTSITKDRLRGFREVLNAAGIKDLLMYSGTDSYKNGFTSSQKVIRENKSIDSIFCGNDIIALGVVDGLRASGVKVPDDVSVVGFDNIRMTAWESYMLTTWEQPLEEMMDSLVEILFEEIKNKSDNKISNHKTIMMKGHLIKRKTVKIKKSVK